MATNIPPHNLGETIDATCLMLDNPDVTTEELMKALPIRTSHRRHHHVARRVIRDAQRGWSGIMTARCGKRRQNRQFVQASSRHFTRQNASARLEASAAGAREEAPEISNIHDGADRHGIDIIID